MIKLTKTHPLLWPLLVCAACAGTDHAVLRAKPGTDAGPDGDATLADAATTNCELADADAGAAVPAAPASDPEITRTPHQFFAIEVVDQEDLPVAGAQLRTVAGATWLTDDTGVAAFYEPDLMGSDVFFFVEAEGYEMAEDAFGYRGQTLAVAEGERGELRMTRVGEPSVPNLGDAQRRLLDGPVPFASDCFSVRVIDQDSRRGVPLAFLRSERTTFVSDSQGMIAICPPETLPATLEVAVDSHGYVFSARSVQLDARAGASVTLELTRENLAERLHRATGQGIYRDSYLLGLRTPRPADRLAGRVVRQDAVNVAEIDGERFWLWGNTDYPDYPLGNFFGSAARSDVRVNAPEPYDQGALELAYLTSDDDKARPMGDALEPTNLPSWLGPLVVARDEGGDAHVFAAYGKPRGDLSLAARGLAELDDSDVFASATTYPVDDFIGPAGQALYVDHDASPYVYFSSPVRIRARPEDLRDPSTYERYTAFTDEAGTQLSRRADGSLDYQFRTGAKPTTPEALTSRGVAEDQALTGHLIDASSGVGIVRAGDGATARADYRGRFIRIFQQLGGVSSFAGEIWYAEADTPMGPWVYARKILTHDRYTFYAPFIQTSFFQGDGHLMYFEGSYTTALAGDDVDATPRYERNQIAYQLDLSDPRLALPVAVYDLAEGRGRFTTAAGLRGYEDDVAPTFYAPELPSEGTLAVHWSGPSCAARSLELSQTPTTPALFYAFAPGARALPSFLVPLYAFENDAGEAAYALQDRIDGYERKPEPFAYVWPSPSGVRSPVSSYLPNAWVSAGEDQCVVLESGETRTTVELEGMSTLDEAARAERATWTLDGEPCPVATTLRTEVALPEGVHTLTLEVELADGRRLRDSLIVEVAQPASVED